MKKLIPAIMLASVMVLGAPPQAKAGNLDCLATANQVCRDLYSGINTQSLYACYDNAASLCNDLAAGGNDPSSQNLGGQSLENKLKQMEEQDTGSTTSIPSPTKDPKPSRK